jgi:hypothetical protein
MPTSTQATAAFVPRRYVPLKESMVSYIYIINQLLGINY